MKKKTSLIAATIMILSVSVAAGLEVNVPGTGISVKVPPGWTVDTQPRGGPFLVLYSPAVEGFKSTVNLSAEKLDGKSSQEWLSEYKAGLQKHVDDYKMIKEGHRNLGGLDYYAIEFRGMQGAVMLHWLQAIRFQGGKAWIFSGVTREKLADGYLRTFQEVFGSVYFPPPPPGDLTAELIHSVGEGPAGVLLTWADTPLAEGGYEIQRRNARLGAWRTIAVVPAGTVTYTDSIGQCGLEVRYRVRALNPKGDSDWSKEITVVAGECGTATGEKEIDRGEE